jgi:glycine cleavage system aminomethyltransferase T
VIEAVRRSPATRLHVARGASFTREAGWELVEHYGEPEAERERLLGSVGVCDVTPRAKVDARGDVERLRDVESWMQIGPDWGMAFGLPGEEEKLVDVLDDRLGSGGMVTDATHLFAGYALAGAGLDDLVARLTGWDHRTLEPGRATGAPFGEVRAVVVRRPSPPSVLEVYVATELGRYAWETFVAAAERLGGGPIGWAALRAEGWS